MRFLHSLRKKLLKKYPLFHGCAVCPYRSPARQLLNTGLPEPEFPVDVIFTWVNGNDPNLIAKRNQYLPPEAQQTQEAQGNSLYRDSDELRYALRSLEAYAPWVRRIAIVTDGQTPSWLETANPRIQVVDHTECIPSGCLPTFNSHVIEAHLHLIPDLSEHFIYCNDDFFLLGPCSKSDFFTLNGLPYLFVDWRPYRRQGYAEMKPHTASYANVREWLETHGVSPVPDIIAAHAHYPLTKSIMALAYDFYGEAVSRFGHNKFRTLNDMAFACHAAPLLACALKRVVPRDMPFYYINAKRFDRLTYYEAMLREKDLGTLPPFLCLNDVGDAPEDDPWQLDMQAFLQAYYPAPSSFEIFNNRSPK